MSKKVKTDAWMPLWIGAYLADTMRLSTIQHGAYMLLLMAYWRERCALPDDDEELRSITKTEKSEWKQMRPVLSKFFKVEDGKWWHKRVEQEMAAADDRSNKSSQKAAKAAEARWGHTDKHSSSNAPSMPEALLEHIIDECPTPSPIHKDISPIGSVGGASLPNCPVTDVVALYHEVLPELPAVRLMGEKRQKAMRVFWRWILTSKKIDQSRRAETAEEGLAWIRTYFERARDNDFLMGRAAKGAAHSSWQCDLDFLLTDKGMKHVIEKTREAA